MTTPLRASPLSGLDALPFLEGLARLSPGVVVIDRDARIAWLSESIPGTGRDPGALVGRPWRSFLADPEQADALLARLRREGGIWNEPIDVFTLDGESQTVQVAAILLEHGAAKGAIVALVRGRSDPAWAAEEFRRTVSWLSAVLDSSPDPVVVADRDGKLTYANRAVQYVLGWEPEQVKGRSVEDFLVDPGDAERLSRALEPQHRALHEEVELRCADRGTVWVSLSASPLRLTDRTVAGAVAFLRDETERREFKARLERKNAELEQTVRSVSHDLRGPLVSVMGFSRLLREDFGESLGGRGRHYLARVEEAGRTMEALIRELLDFSRIGDAPETLELLDPRETLQQLHAELKQPLDERGVALLLPEDPPLVRCERTRLYQIFANLIGNAVRHMGPCERGTIAVEILEQEPGWRLTVRDNGRGIPPSQQERIFGMFQSLPGPDAKKGTGIGLAIVKKIAEVHGGRAWVESEPGRGAAFHVTLASP